MHFINFKKFAALKKETGLDPKDLYHEEDGELVGTFGYDDHHRNIYVRIKDFTHLGGTFYSPILSAEPQPSKYGALVISINPKAYILGLRAPVVVVKNGDELGLVIDCSDEKNLTAMSKLPWAVKFSAIRGEKL